MQNRTGREGSELIVHQLPGAWGLPSISPFCLKLDTYLRIANIPFRAIVDPTPFKAPKGKLPWIEHEGNRIGDSGFIIEYLERRFGCDLDAGLSPADRATARALRRLIEENLYWTMVYERWMVDENWRSFRHVVLGGISAPMRSIVAPIARRGVRRQLHGHGIGLHSPEEIRAIGLGDLTAVVDFLGDKPFLMGEAASGIDAVAFGFLANIVRVPIEGPVKTAALQQATLLAYLDRIEQRYFGPRGAPCNDAANGS
jgi:glutathione S-transferase